MLGADTDVAIDGRLLGKPEDADGARSRLETLSGRTHEVLGAIVLLGRRRSRPERSGVAGQRGHVSRPSSRRRSTSTSAPASGGTAPAAYAIQGLGSILVEELRGDFSNVVGLSVALLLHTGAKAARSVPKTLRRTFSLRLFQCPRSRLEGWLPSATLGPQAAAPSARRVTFAMGIFRNLTGFGGRDMAVDLGTANTLVYVRGRGIVLSEPSVVAVDSATGEVHAVGVDAKRMLGRTPGTIQAIRPLKDGVIADFDVTEEMLRHFIQRVHQNRFAHPRVVVCVPSGVTGVEKRAVEEACLSAGARQAYLIEEPMAAAIGCGLPVADPTGSMILDIGGGTSEVAVISLGGIVVSESIRVGGDEMDDAIVAHCKHQHKLAGRAQQTAEEVKLEIGSAAPMPEQAVSEIRGRDLVTGLPKTIELTSTEIRAALEEPVSQIVAAVKDTLDRTPPELAGDIMDRGITLAGGGALLRGMDQRMREECQMPCQLTESPLTCVAVGSGRSLEEFEVIHRMSRTTGRRRVGAAV